MRFETLRRAAPRAPSASQAGARQRTGAPAGLPLYLRAPGLAPRVDREHEAHAVAEGSGRDVTPRPALGAPSAVELGLARIARAGAPGEPLAAGVRARMEPRIGADLDGVRVHDDARAHALTSGVGTDALTIGRDIYFAPGRLDAGSYPGDRLLAHELTHVAQQGGADTGHVDGHLTSTLPVPQGKFVMNMLDNPSPTPGTIAGGMTGTIRFQPDPRAPYSAEIELLQIVNTTDVPGRTATAGAPADWSRINAGQEAPRGSIMTTGTGVAPRGWFVDAHTDPAANAQSSALRPYYRDSWGPAGDEPGWVRSPTDVKAALLTDGPGMSFDTNFDFETVAKGNDNQSIYGSLLWGFQVRAGAPTAEYARASGVASANVQEALDRFRVYFTHEPTIIYFDTDIDTPMAGEDVKLREFIPYLTSFPDVQLEITGFADETGPAAHNLTLSGRRAANVGARIEALGIPASRIGTMGVGMTHEFAGGAPGTGTFAAQPGHPATTAGTLRANRRVVIVFTRTASTLPGP